MAMTCLTVVVGAVSLVAALFGGVVPTGAATAELLSLALAAAAAAAVAGMSVLDG